MRKGYVYSLICPKTFEVRYVGITVQKLAYRLAKHKKDADKKGHTHKINWLRQLQKQHLLDQLEIRAIEEVGVDTLTAREIYWISYFRSAGLDLVNTAPGGSTGSQGYRHTNKAKQRIAMAARRKQLGRKASIETRRKISLSLIGSKRRLGKPFTEEAKKKISESKKGAPAWNRKTVNQYTLDGTFVKTWSTVAEAKKMLAISNISTAARGLGYRKQAGGFVWRYI